MKALATQIVPPNTNGSEIDVIPLEDSIALSPAKQFKAEVALLIRISRGGSLDQPAGQHEEQVLHAVIEKLEALRTSK